MDTDRAGGLLSCSHCGSSEQLSEMAALLEIGDGSDKKCPTCLTTLASARLDGQPLWCCQRCEGLLIAMRSFVGVIDAARARIEQAGSVPPRKQKPEDRIIECPACHQPMLSHFYGGPGNLVIDTCERCQLNWLDPGELQRIARAS